MVGFSLEELLTRGGISFHIQGTRYMTVHWLDIVMISGTNYSVVLMDRQLWQLSANDRPSIKRHNHIPTDRLIRARPHNLHDAAEGFMLIDALGGENASLSLGLSSKRLWLLAPPYQILALPGGRNDFISADFGLPNQVAVDKGRLL